MKAHLLTACVLLSITCSAQRFVNSLSVELPDSAITGKVEWVDLDNDGLLDVFAFATLSSGEHFFITYKTDTVRGLVDGAAQLTGFTSSVYRLADFDHDNDMDIIVSGISENVPRTSFFENSSDFKFIVNSSIGRAGSIVRFADINSDGKGDLILSGSDDAGSFFSIYRFGTAWTLAHDSLEIEASSIDIFDFDGDSDNDIFLTGLENNVVVSEVLRNHGALWFDRSSALKIARGNTSVGDLNHDGRLDLFLTGVNGSGQNVSVQFINQGDSFVAKDTLAPVSNGKVFLADFNSDGKCDIQIIGKNISDTLNAVVLRDSGTVVLNSAKLDDQSFGDYDRDGDLDLLQLSGKPNLLKLQVQKNEVATANKGPFPPFRAFGFTIFNRMFLHWDKSVDDHTPQNAITYDVTLQSQNAELQVGEFDLISNKRLTVSHGNAGTRNYLLLKPRSISPFHYTIQAVDNSMETARNILITGEPGVCVGSADACPSQTIVEVPACRNETLAFSAEDDARWFSLSKGFLADGATFQLKVIASDTIFSFSPGDGCPSLKIYLIMERKNFIKRTTETRFLCDGQMISLASETDWTNILWASQLRGNLGEEPSISYTFSQNDTVTFRASNDVGCAVERKTALRMSKPQITLEADLYQIVKGASVQFGASGGEEYSWTPAESLNNAVLQNPVASPLESTDYTVVVKDTLGCEASATVRVIVEGDAFIPTLFTPNDDGKNDDVKVYGLANVSNFKFTIQNREGKVVYEANDLTQVSSSGWDGTVNGARQPAGVYFWKVRGIQPSGRKLQLNGKQTGSIVLIR